MSEEEQQPTLTVYDLAAREFLAALDAAIARIPKPLTHRPHKLDSFTRAHRAIPREFIEQLAGGGLVTFDGPFDRQKAQDILQFLSAFRYVRHRLTEVLSDLTFTMEKLYAEIASEALMSYHLTKRMALARNNSDYEHSAKQLAKTMGRKGKNRKKAPEPATEP